MCISTIYKSHEMRRTRDLGFARIWKKNSKYGLMLEHDEHSLWKYFYYLKKLRNILDLNDLVKKT